MNVKIILKIHLQQSWVNILHHLSMYAISLFKTIEKSMMHKKVKFSWNTFCESLREHVMNIIVEEQNEFINKRAAGIISKCQNILYLLIKNCK